MRSEPSKVRHSKCCFQNNSETELNRFTILSKECPNINKGVNGGHSTPKTLKQCKVYLNEQYKLKGSYCPPTPATSPTSSSK